jgi:hypothetical protein
MILRRTSALVIGFAWSGCWAGCLTSSRWARWNMLPLFFFSVSRDYQEQWILHFDGAGFRRLVCFALLHVVV